MSFFRCASSTEGHRATAPSARTATSSNGGPGADVPLALLDLDLSPELHYASAQLRLDQDGLVFARGEVGLIEVDGSQFWPHAADQRLEFHECRGMAWVRLTRGGTLLASWPVTAHRFGATQKFIAQYNEFQVRTPERLMGEHPTRGALRDVKNGVGTLGSLFRLSTFAKRNVRALTAGVTLTVLATGFSLVPPYLTMPLIDRVLIPWQNGEVVPLRVPGFYLSLLVGAAVIAWALGWARTYVLAWFSETLSADLRNTTYAQLQRLSMEFFSGKRTGDLIARISSDTDRICFFLSVHLLDFVTDVLMITMTAVILIGINPTLACATLIPLPAILWLV
ncbi:MAG: hypothetical protein KDA60_05750, partial [Planctomycetales bacterium]|nr:hypothetical protein [Planctomycetales bacterium]